MQGDVLGYYKIFDVKSDSDIEEIKCKYRELAKFWHPDVNQAEEAMEKFQFISKAWEVLSVENERLNYDLLSQVYDKDSFPEIENIAPFKSGEKDIRALSICLVKANFIKFKSEKKFVVTTYKDALFEHIGATFKNWLLGWWHPRAIAKNIGALKENWKHPISSEDSLRVLVHNVVAYKKENKNELAVIAAINALEYANSDLKQVLHRFISKQQLRILRPKSWNLCALRAVQLGFPIMLGLVLILFLGQNYGGFVKKNSSAINYYQEIDYGGRGSGINDLVVGKILDIPINKKDESKLYHLKKNTKVMYGPSDEFDVLANVVEGTTIRLTGVSPDRVWARIMIDNGEMGFVKTKVLAKGIGNEIPYGSKIIE